jgi:hypothetical protein
MSYTHICFNSGEQTVAEAVGDWFFDRREVKEIDCEYPCNPTCFNVVLEQPYQEG